MMAGQSTRLARIQPWSQLCRGFPLSLFSGRFEHITNTQVVTYSKVYTFLPSSVFFAPGPVGRGKNGWSQVRRDR